VLPAAVDTAETLLGESYVKELLKIQPAENTNGERISGISEGLCNRLTDQLKTSCFVMQADETADVIKDAQLMPSILYPLEKIKKEYFSFRKPTDGRATSLEVFNISNHFLGDNDSWENCTDEAQSTSCRNAGLQELMTKKALHTSWTHCILHRQALVPGNVNEELQIVCQVVVGFVNYVQSPKQFAEMKTLYKTCVTIRRQNYCPKMSQGI
jgi:hypothetical protein